MTGYQLGPTAGGKASQSISDQYAEVVAPAISSDDIQLLVSVNVALREPFGYGPGLSERRQDRDVRCVIGIGPNQQDACENVESAGDLNLPAD